MTYAWRYSFSTGMIRHPRTGAPSEKLLELQNANSSMQRSRRLPKPTDASGILWNRSKSESYLHARLFSTMDSDVTLCLSVGCTPQHIQLCSESFLRFVCFWQTPGPAGPGVGTFFSARTVGGVSHLFSSLVLRPGSYNIGPPEEDCCWASVPQCLH